MAKYIITNGYSYICDNLCDTTKEIDKAKIFDKIKTANNVYRSSISKEYKLMGFQVREAGTGNSNSNNSVTINTNVNVSNTASSNDKINSSYTEVDIDDLKKSINDLSEKLTTLKGNKEWLLDEESNIDKQISDILHYIEFYNFSASDGYKLCKALKDLRLRRRKIKNELELINIVNTQSLNNVASGQNNKAINGLDDKKYAPRILQELFDNRNIDDIINKMNASEKNQIK